MPPRASNISHKPHEVEYMRIQGAFTELPTEVCNELIRCYFQHVHFFLPIVDAPGFLNEYINNGSQNISRLLLWSMLLAAANVNPLLPDRRQNADLVLLSSQMRASYNEWDFHLGKP